MMGPILYTRTTTNTELHEILFLQSKNLADNISEEIIKTEGFVTVRHSFKLLKKLHDVCPHFIAKYNNRVVGYAISMHPKFKNEIEVLQPMFQKIDKELPFTNYIVMGQICIDKTFRKKGIFKRLYQEMKECLHENYQKIITEVDVTNTRSLNAHSACGFIILKKYTDSHSNQEWVILELDIS